MGEMTSMTIRAQIEDCERFKDLSRRKNISQGDLLRELMDITEKLDGESISNGIKEFDDGSVKILLKEVNNKANSEKEAKIYTFKGRLITYLPFPREFLNVQITFSKIYEELKFDYTDKKYSTSYQFYIYQMEDKEYLIYEYLNVSENISKVPVAVIRRAKSANDLREILIYLNPYISLNEAEMIEFALAEEISANSELTKIYIK